MNKEQLEIIINILQNLNSNLESIGREVKNSKYKKDTSEFKIEEVRNDIIKLKRTIGSYIG